MTEPTIAEDQELLEALEGLYRYWASTCRCDISDECDPCQAYVAAEKAIFSARTRAPKRSEMRDPYFQVEEWP